MIKSIEEQMYEADIILSTVQKIDPDCIIAGGAPRDWYFNRQCKDIDLFLSLKQRLSNTKIKEMLSTLGLDVQQVNPINPDGLNYGLNPDIKVVFDVKNPDTATPIQIVVMNSSTFNTVDSFAFNICKIWYKNQKIRTTPSFKYAVDNKVLIKTGEIFRSTDAYTKRIRDKFPNWPYFDSKLTYLKQVANCL